MKDGILAKKPVRGISILALLALFVAACLVATDAYAKGSRSGGGGFRSGGGSRSKSYGNSSRSKPSGGSYGNSSSRPKPSGGNYGNSSSEPKPSGGYGNSAQPSKQGGSWLPFGNKKTAAPQKSAIDTAAQKQRSQKALDDYKAEQNKFSKPAAPVAPTASPSRGPVLQGLRGAGGYSPSTTWYERRRGFYTRTGYAPPPYAYQSAASFGMWDAMALWFILDHFNDKQYAATYYHHSEDPGIQQWRQEAERLAQTNPEMKEKLAGLDQSVAGMAGTPKDPGYVPPDMKDAVLAADVAEKELPPPRDPDLQNASGEKSTLGRDAMVFCLILGGIFVWTWLRRSNKRKSA